MAKKSKSFEDAIIEKFGEKVLDNHTKQIEAISTGSLSLDASIGIGGIPKGMITELSGPEGSGKTSIALNTAKTVANRGGEALYIDAENLLNHSLLKGVLGEDAKIENITILTPDSAEDAFMMAEAGIESGKFEIIILDSIGGMASKKEKEVPFDKDTVGQMPRIVSRFIKRNAYSIRTNNIAILILNQVRDNVGGYTKSYGTPGGHALKHQAAVRIMLSKGETLKRGEESVGILVKFVVRKNKLAAPFRSFEIPLIFGEGIDSLADFIDFAELIGVLQKAGPYYKFNGETLGQGKAATKEKLKQSEELLNNIKEIVYSTIGRLPPVEEVAEEEGEE